MEITTEQIKDLRQESGAGIMDCRNALKETNGDKAKALEYSAKTGSGESPENRRPNGQTGSGRLLYSWRRDASVHWWKLIAKPIS